MRKFNLLFVVCLVALGFHAAFADDDTDVARAAKRGTTTTVVSNRQKSDNSTSTPVLSLASRTANISVKKDSSSQSSRDNRSVKTRDDSNSARSSQTNVSNAAPRGTNVQSRSSVNQKVSDRNSVNRSATQTPVGYTRAATVNRNALNSNKSSNTRTVKRTNTSRAATANSVKDGSSDTNDINKYKKCREIYYSCMDEFCANKDTQLKRCACSSRIHDFDNVKNNMSNVEDKILNFNERLISVNLDKEDAEAISKATEGETAYQQADKSDSKSILDEISNKLKSSTADNNFNKNMSAISLSLNTDSAFDSIDSTLGASTSTKEGANLYNAALPVCREMAAEVCDTDGAAIAESAYQMAIEQDCNTVAKAYETMQDQALDKVREGSALLDMSRLDVHQKRNSDDILTCKKKMLDMMTSSSVCGTDLGKCLDITGRYIDPSTGEAFLTVNLVNLGNLITRPSGDQKWTDAPGNSQFVTFLNSKKTYLEPAMANCQDIGDSVWDDFIEDALSQIKLAQDKKLEDMRQSCTSLTTECLSDTAKSISDFDARALSIFGVTANKTVNEMCANVKTACTALLQTTGGDTDWVGGMSQIQTAKTYDTIIQTCREVGKACIVQTCKSVSGNFGLCESVDKSVNRKSIINRSACWKDVMKCVADAGTDSISKIMTQFNKTPSATGGDFYSENYGGAGSDFIRTNSSAVPCDPNSQSCIYDICSNCGSAENCAICRLAEKIWGNCEFLPTRDLIDISQNEIKKTTDSTETLLSWFADNTGTADLIDSCRDTSCGAGFIPITVDGVTKCVNSGNLSSDKEECSSDLQFTISSNSSPVWENCRPENWYMDDFGNWCQKRAAVKGFLVNDTGITTYNKDINKTTNICIPATLSADNVKFIASFYLPTDSGYYKAGENVLLCIGGDLTYTDTTTTFPNGQTVKCDGGHFVIINLARGTYMGPNESLAATPTTNLPIGSTYPYMYYNYDSSVSPVVKCVFNAQSGSWGTIKSSTFGDQTWEASNTICNKIGYDTNNDGTLDNFYPQNNLEPGNPDTNKPDNMFIFYPN